MKKIKYTILCKRSTLDESGHETFVDAFCLVKMPWSEENEQKAKSEAYNGEYTIEDNGQPEPDYTTADDVLNTLLGVT